MANPSSPNPSFSFSDFPDDVQLCILSFLAPSEIAAFACTSKHFAALCRSDAKLWLALCERRWGSKTRIKQWPIGKLVTYKQLYRTLNDFDSLIGFWRRSGPNSTTLLFFEWGPSFLAGSRVSPSKTGSYRVVKDPFLWLTLYPSGETISFLDPDSRFEMCDVLLQSGDLDLGLLETELVPVNVSFMGKNHVSVEENLSFGHSKSGFRRTSSSGNLGAEEDVIGPDHGLPGSLPDRLMYDIYQHFANRTSPSHDRATRRQRKREKERQGRKKWESEHFLKIVNCSPTPSRPLQGLWKLWREKKRNQVSSFG
ncbi:F-box protein At3g12350-like isoform X2 [Diospyros lotus]|uniref:F-box protein At3g12350-like isoform X2 n=1 Tax=Diospyros lotus TaxID=55363 RepID=UPI002257AA00|nr:F-box protein At3g12350-like isoform X2 [Diospyros lotus]